MYKRRLKVIETYIYKYRDINNKESTFDMILWFIHCDLDSLKFWEDKLLGDKENE